MNPATDKSFTVTRPDGSTIEVIQPGAKLVGSSNWRLTRELYDRYAGMLRQALLAWPNESKFPVPDGISPNTFCARFRDARKALFLFKYEPDLYDLLVATGNEAVISMDPDGKAIWFRQRAQAQKQHKITAEHVYRMAPGAMTPPVQVTDLPDKDTLTAMCRLISTGHILGPFNFKGQVDAQLRDELETAFNVGFAWDEARGITTLL